MKHYKAVNKTSENVGIQYKDDTEPFITFDYKGLLELVIYFNDEDSLAVLFDECKDKQVTDILRNEYGVDIG